MAEYNQEGENLLIELTSDELAKYELLLDLIADALIQSEFVDTTTVENNQKFIRNGQLQVGQGSGVLALFQKDIKANQEDLNNTILNNAEVEENLIQIAINLDFGSLDQDEPIVIAEGGDFGVTISINGGGDVYNGLPITDLVIAEGNPLNVSQFIPLERQQTIINVERSEEFLDTTIFELLPSGDSRQSRIIRFFQELNALLPPTTPEFDLDNDGRVDRVVDGTWSGSLQYQQDNSISYAQDNIDGNIDEEQAFIHRIKGGAYPPNDTNLNRTIEDIYNTILPYLTDILEDPIELEDMPEYKNQSSGYLKFRNPNQGIIIRNTNQEFLEGLNPNNPTFLETGFTITMWVRFLDKVSEGTLFNFGNPTRAENPFGFKLETFVLNQDDRTYYDGDSSTEGDEPVEGDTLYTWGSFAAASSDLRLPKQDTFGNSSVARFVRLQVREEGTADSGVRDSHTGISGMRKVSWSYPTFDYRDGIEGSRDLRLMGCTFIPEDFNEWYFICASYNPNIIEPNTTTIEPVVYDTYRSNKDFWLNQINPDNGLFASNSGYGNKCKIEIISRSDLLRARGFKV